MIAVVPGLKITLIYHTKPLFTHHFSRSTLYHNVPPLCTRHGVITKG